MVLDPLAEGGQKADAKAGGSLARYGFAVAIAVAIAVAVIALAKLSEFMAEARWVDHTHQVIRGLARLESAIVDAEAAERGYVLSGSGAFLTAYREARRSVDADLDSLQNLLVDNPEQLLRLDEVRLRTARELENLERIVRLVESGQRAAASRSINASTDGERMRATRLRLREMLDVEEGLLVRRHKSAEQGAAIARVLVVAGSAVSLGLLLFAYAALQRENARRTASEATTREANVFLDRLFEAVPHILYVKSVPDFRYLRVNKAHEAMFEIPRERLVGKTDAELFAPAQVEHINAEDRSTLAGGSVYDAEVDQLVSANRGVRTLHKKKVVIPDAQGQPMYLLGIAEDITEHKAAQREIIRLNETLERRARELEITNKELESFTYSVSHDLRAPLRAINGFALMLSEDHADKLDDEGRRLLNVVRSNAQRMGALIDDLLAFSRIGRATLTRVDVDMGGLVASVVQEIGEPKDVVMPACDVGSLPAAVGDPSLLKQVWFNLISNAIKYSGKNPAARVEVRGERVNGECVYRVADNGAGFDMRYADKLFGVFQRLHRVEEFPGTGVGLAIVQRIVVRHGGRVWAEGKVNEGATFHFALPIEERVHG